MDYQTALENGYYFDRCIDLDFYDENMVLLAKLRTPQRGFKPSITVKGEFIEGGYAISSFISVQNMAYDVDVNSVSYIDCFMYTSGLRESNEHTEKTAGSRRGHSILFSVLYADQEKEPPNRAVRFQCTVASQDRRQFDTFINIKPDGSVIPGSEKNFIVGNGGKEGTKTYGTLIGWLGNIANAYNDALLKRTNVTNENSINFMYITGKLKLEKIICDEKIAETKITVEAGTCSFGDLLRKLNSYKTGGNGNASYCGWKVYPNKNTLVVEKIIPSDWRRIAISEGYDTETKQSIWYAKEKGTIPYIYKLPSKEKTVSTETTNVVWLDYVKSAYRSENVINVETIFDDRITPGCMCAIQGNAIMGKHKGYGKKAGSRLISYAKNVVLFRVTGGIQYEFSTTDGNSMFLTGITVDENYNGKKDMTVYRGGA